MRGRQTSARSHVHSRRSLAARGQLVYAFGGQAIFVSLALFALGVYLLEEEFANPVQAQSAGLLFAAVLIAASVSLLCSLYRPARKGRRHRILVHLVPMSPGNDHLLPLSECRRLSWHDDRDAVSPHDRYVDHTRIRL